MLPLILVAYITPEIITESSAKPRMKIENKNIAGRVRFHTKKLSQPSIVLNSIQNHK